MLYNPETKSKWELTSTTNFLYLCHFLSTWNARSYEFSSVLFTAAAFPNGLSAESWVGITTHAAIVLFASSLGRWVDHAPSRLKTLLTTVSVNRVAVIAACICWSIIVKSNAQDKVTASGNIPEASKPSLSEVGHWKGTIFLIILALGIIERLSRLANLVSIERDWVPTLVVSGVEDKQAPRYDLSHLNAVMARIDLVCKLGSPILMSMFMSVTGSSRVGAFALIALNLITWPFEYWTAKTVWHGSEELRELKSSSRILEEDDTAGEANADQIREERPPVVQIALDCVVKSLKTLLSWIYDYGAGLHYYFTTEVWMPSVAMSMLHFSVLAFSGTLTVFLVNSGFSLGLITWAEVLSAVFELSSTFIFPWGIRVLSAQRKDAYAALPNDTANDTGESGIYEEAEAKDEPSLEEQQRTGVSRLGLWALGLMLLCLIPTVPSIWKLSTGEAPPSETSDQPSAWQAHHVVVICIILFISASRLGRWTNRLCSLQLGQSCVKPAQRSLFAATEESLGSLFGLGHWIATVIWSTHQDFRWIALSGFLVSVGSTCLYTYWLLRRDNRTIS